MGGLDQLGDDDSGTVFRDTIMLDIAVLLPPRLSISATLSHYPRSGPEKAPRSQTQYQAADAVITRLPPEIPLGFCCETLFGQCDCYSAARGAFHSRSPKTASTGVSKT